MYIVMLHGHPIMMAIATTQAGYSKWDNLTSAARVANKGSDRHPLPMRKLSHLRRPQKSQMAR